jgi:HSP20 family molecular chaperone IbpA
VIPLARIRSVARIYLERTDHFPPDEDLRRIFDRLRTGTDVAAECTLPLDVVETADGIELVMDLPGIAVGDVSVAFVRDTLVIMGRKLPPVCEQGGAAFHLAERAFGQFARAVQVSGAYDGGRAEATLRAGELRVSLPRLEDRRGAEIRIAVRVD